MIGYMRILNPSLELHGTEFNTFTNAIFSDKYDELIPFLINHFRKKQAERTLVNHHNTLPKEDIICILNHAISDPQKALGYIYRLIISFGIALLVRPTTMWNLTKTPFKNISSNYKQSYIYILN